MLDVFIGYDHRQAISFTVLHQSILETASVPVRVSSLRLPTLPLKRAGLTPFTWSRFLVPWLMDYKGWALFLDVDILVRGDLKDLIEYCQGDGVEAECAEPLALLRSKYPQYGSVPLLRESPVLIRIRPVVTRGWRAG